jgi:hypothetical protein
MGYVFTAAVGRTYWVHWAIPFRLDPVRCVLVPVVAIALILMPVMLSTLT